LGAAAATAVVTLGGGYVATPLPLLPRDDWSVYSISLSFDFEKTFKILIDATVTKSNQEDFS
jgi:hypothetical protein